jgi:hypothetical protein
LQTAQFFCGIAKSPIHFFLDDFIKYFSTRLV